MSAGTPPGGGGEGGDVGISKSMICGRQARGERWEAIVGYPHQHGGLFSAARWARSSGPLARASSQDLVLPCRWQAGIIGELYIGDPCQDRPLNPSLPGLMVFDAF